MNTSTTQAKNTVAETITKRFIVEESATVAA